MRSLPSSFSDFKYLLSKIGFGFIRGMLYYLFFKKGSYLPCLGNSCKIISCSKLYFGKYVFIGSNSYLDANSTSGVYFSDGVTIRENAVIQCRSGLNPPGVGLFIDSNTFVGPFVKIGVGGLIKIGANCQIGSHCSFNAESHIFSDGSFTSGKTSRIGITIGDNVWIGDGVIILDGVQIGKNSVIGAGSLVNKSVPANSIYVGVPAKFIKSL